MKTSINFCDFCDNFNQAGRNEQFSYAAKRALFDYLEDLEEDLGEEIELDVIALCCEYTEYECIEEMIEDYKSTFENEDMEDMDEHELIDMVREHTTVIEFDNGIIIQDF